MWAYSIFCFGICYYFELLFNFHYFYFYFHRYPLFIDNLVQNTPPTHPDYRNLEEARIKMLNVAKEINDYTKRLDLGNVFFLR